MAGLVTIGELALAVQQALADRAYPGQKSGRVREVPDRRTIRYYTTIGLLDKPAEMRGRTAYYGERHLLQLVAIKRLQAQGKSLVEIQQLLTGAGDSVLRKWSEMSGQLAATLQPLDQEPEAKATESSPALREAFWAATPQSNVAARQSHPKLAPATTAVHLKVMDHVTLVVEGGVDSETLSRLQPVLEELKGILKPNGERIATKQTNDERTDPNEDHSNGEQP